MKIENSNYDFYFSDLNNNKITDFELDQTNFYWFSYGFSSNQTIQEGIEKELKKYPGAKGLKKLKVRIYNKSWFTFSVLPNPLGLFTSGLWIYVGYPLGFTNKSYYVTGEVF
ncbi:hypothetical protein [Leptospira wolbachii]|nr:hypothetical protein [Leptospira wolbachii]